MTEIKYRLKEGLDIRGMKPIDLCNKTKISKSAISQYLSGYAKPKADRIFIIAKALDVNEAWLMGFDVPMERKTATTDELVTLINSLDDNQQKNVIDYIQFLKSKKE